MVDKTEQTYIDKSSWPDGTWNKINFMNKTQKLEVIVWLRDQKDWINEFFNETGYTNLINIRNEIDKILKELEGD